MMTGYGSGQIYGKVGTDKVCLGVNDTCAPHHQIASVLAQQGLMNLNSEGIIGMALGGTPGEGTLYMYSLKKAGAIDHQVFAFLVSAEGHKKSKVTFGGTELNKYAKGPMHWHKITPGQMWYVKMENVGFEGVNLMNGNLDNALVDTGTSYISMPVEGIKKIGNILMSRYGMGPKVINHTGNRQHDCSTEAYALVQPLKFYMDGTTYNLPKEDWLPRREGKCMIQIMENRNSYGIVFGINWFNSYYTAFDMENRRVGFAESIYSTLTPAESKEFNAKVLTNLSEVDMADYLEETRVETTVETATICLIGASLIALISAALCYYKKQQKRTMTSDLDTMYNFLPGTNSSKVVDDDETFDIPLNDEKHEHNASFVSNLTINTANTSTFWSPSYINEVVLDKTARCDSSDTTEEDICEFGIGSLDD